MPHLLQAVVLPATDSFRPKGTTIAVAAGIKPKPLMGNTQVVILHTNKVDLLEYPFQPKDSS